MRTKTLKNELFFNTWIFINIFNFDDPITGESRRYQEVKRKSNEFWVPRSCYYNSCHTYIYLACFSSRQNMSRFCFQFWSSNFPPSDQCPHPTQVRCREKNRFGLLLQARGVRSALNILVINICKECYSYLNLLEVFSFVWSMGSRVSWYSKKILNYLFPTLIPLFWAIYTHTKMLGINGTILRLPLFISKSWLFKE